MMAGAVPFPRLNWTVPPNRTEEQDDFLPFIFAVMITLDNGSSERDKSDRWVVEEKNR